MSASASAILHWNGIPVFADIDTDSFCMDIEAVKKLITKRTVAIMTVDIFGQSANILQIVELAHGLGIKVICDTAQAPGARVGTKLAGTLGDIGGISLNYHKHIHTGEGGVLFTDDDELADRMRLIRNHAEVVVEPKGETRLDNMVGHNFRLGEIESAIGIEQLRKLPALAERRQRTAEQLSLGLANLTGLLLPKVSAGNTHVYYVYGMILEGYALEVGRPAIIAALEAEGVIGLMNGYQNIHLLPVYQNKIAFGNDGFPWTSPYCDNEVSYAKGICPVSEALHDSSFLGLQLCLFEYGSSEVQMVIGAFQKVWANLEVLSGYLR
jgi:dTDP-4-amino-4,6-dideoxygalactose transaminase